MIRTESSYRQVLRWDWLLSRSRPSGQNQPIILSSQCPAGARLAPGLARRRPSGKSSQSRDDVIPVCSATMNDGALAFVEPLSQPCRLHTLILRANILEDDAVIPLMEVLTEQKVVTHLDLACNLIPSSAVRPNIL